MDEGRPAGAVLALAVGARRYRTAPPWSRCTAGVPQVPRSITVHPPVQVIAHELVVGQVRVSPADAVDLLGLAGAERLVRVQAPVPLQKPLPAQDLVDAGDAAG